MPDDPVLLDDTIAALASSPGAGARGIVRAAGPDVACLLGTVIAPASCFSRPARARRFEGRLAVSGLPVPVPVAVQLWPGRRSYTGQPMAELHTVGSPPLLEAILSELYLLGMRPARRGEFTLRAFLAGRIDLVQAEAVLGVIDAHDHRELEVALRQLAGGISGRISEVRSDLLDLLADLEAGLDFVDDGVEFIPPAMLLERVRVARQNLCMLLDRAGASGSSWPGSPMLAKARCLTACSIAPPRSSPNSGEPPAIT